MRIGITGGIGTGKSFVINYVRSKGYKVIDSDFIARQLMLKGNINYNNIINNFGDDILSVEGEIDRIKLRTIVFNDEEKRKILNKITHPNIMKKIFDDSDDNNIYFIEVPLLFEENLDKYFDEIWLIDCSEKVQIERIIKRSNLSKNEVLDIISCQMPRREKIKRAKIIIESEQANLEKHIDDLLHKLDKRVINEK